MTIAGRSAAAAAEPAIDAGRRSAAARRRRRRSTRRRPRTRRDGRGRPGRPGRAAGPGPRPAARVGDEPDAARVVLVPRVVQRGPGVAAVAVAWLSVHGWSPEVDGAAAVVGGDGAADGRVAVRGRSVGPGGAGPDRPRPGRLALVGGLAVDGEVDADLLVLGRDPDPEDRRRRP